MIFIYTRRKEEKTVNKKITGKKTLQNLSYLGLLARLLSLLISWWACFDTLPSVKPPAPYGVKANPDADDAAAANAAGTEAEVLDVGRLRAITLEEQLLSSLARGRGTVGLAPELGARGSSCESPLPFQGLGVKILRGAPIRAWVPTDRCLSTEDLFCFLCISLLVEGAGSIPAGILGPATELPPPVISMCSIWEGPWFEAGAPLAPPVTPWLLWLILSLLTVVAVCSCLACIEVIG